MPNEARHSLLGGGRYKYVDVKHVQLFCTGLSAINNLELMEKHITDIINANITGMQTVAYGGIDEIKIGRWVPIRTTIESDLNELKANPTGVARSYAEVEMLYHLYKI